MTKDLCIYHGNCADGFGAAWAMRKARPDTEFYAGVHQHEPPDTKGRNVYFVDFCYKPDVMKTIYSSCNSLVILDHHKSAIEDCSWLLDEPNCTGIFDLERSGAMITWDWFHEGSQPPQLFHHIQDRDLWMFKLDGTEAIQSALFSYPYDFDTWDQLMKPEALAILRADGVAIARKQHKDIAELRDVMERRMTIGGHDVPVMSLPYTHVSDAAHAMAIGEPFAACYWDESGARTFGLRSTDEGADVCEIAKQYGGGGHRNAAGFAVPRDHELARS